MKGEEEKVSLLLNQLKEYLKYLLKIKSGLPLNDFQLERIKPCGVLIRKLIT